MYILLIIIGVLFIVNLIPSAETREKMRLIDSIDKSIEKQKKV
jgi:hypothetical protein